MKEEQPGPGGRKPDEPLPATLTFVLVMGATFIVLWFGLFVLLKDRW